MIRVLVVDDQALVRAGFEALVESAEDLLVVGSAANGAEAVELARSVSPDVVLMLTTFDLDEYVYAALKSGASGFMLKDTPPVELLEGIRVVARGDALLSPGVTRHLIEAFVRRPAGITAPPAALEGLTERETEVLVLIARGLSNTEIGEQLFVSPATVKTHISRLLMKLDARDRAQLVVLSYETGLVTAPDRPA
jgi:DNA-binding NarL/FixJ family response regulator